MFINVDNCRTTPGEQEVTETSAGNDGQTQPDIVGHEDKHQHIADSHLDHV